VLGAVGTSAQQVPEADWDQANMVDAWGLHLGIGLFWSEQPHRIWGFEKPQEDGPAPWIGEGLPL